MNIKTLVKKLVIINSMLGCVYVHTMDDSKTYPSSNLNLLKTEYLQYFEAFENVEQTKLKIIECEELTKNLHFIEFMSLLSECVSLNMLHNQKEKIVRFILSKNFSLQQFIAFYAIIENFKINVLRDPIAIATIRTLVKKGAENITTISQFCTELPPFFSVKLEKVLMQEYTGEVWSTAQRQREEFDFTTPEGVDKVAKIFPKTEIFRAVEQKSQFKANSRILHFSEDLLNEMFKGQTEVTAVTIYDVNDKIIKEIKISHPMDYIRCGIEGNYLVIIFKDRVELYDCTDFSKPCKTLNISHSAYGMITPDKKRIIIISEELHSYTGKFFGKKWSKVYDLETLEEIFVFPVNMTPQQISPNGQYILMGDADMNLQNLKAYIYSYPTFEKITEFVVSKFNGQTIPPLLFDAYTFAYCANVECQYAQYDHGHPIDNLTGYTDMQTIMPTLYTFLGNNGFNPESKLLDNNYFIGITDNHCIAYNLATAGQVKIDTIHLKKYENVASLLTKDKRTILILRRELGQAIVLRLCADTLENMLINVVKCDTTQRYLSLEAKPELHPSRDEEDAKESDCRVS